ncbi:tRNA lysidine(34) synthetase TilS [Candidatus Peregrinibacteria bacterium]|nr:MAG: tRNA lysidine(34) synthetase TilS [Candidatus Peregrinibacteria bacterium]
MELSYIPSGKIVVALSGGVDSCVLLHVLYQKTKDIVIAHLNHNIRGSESDADQVFVEILARKYEIPLYQKKLEEAPVSEDDARKQRYVFLQEVCDKEHAKCLAVAHHLDDQAETVLLQLLRGASAFSPMPEFASNNVWRPLLHFSKQDIIEYAQTNQIRWREDASNTENHFSRNKLRNIILPEFEKMNDQAIKHIVEFSQESLLQKQYITKQAEKYIAGRTALSRTEFIQLDSVIQHEIIHIFAPQLYKIHMKEVCLMIHRGIGRKEKHGFTLDMGMIRMKNLL